MTPGNVQHAHHHLDRTVVRSVRLATLCCVAAMAACERTEVTAAVVTGEPQQLPYTLLWRNVSTTAVAPTVVDDANAYFFDDKHIVTAVDKASGVVRWTRELTYSTDPGFRQGFGMAIAGGRLVVGDLDVFGLDRTTGAIAWRFSPVALPYEQAGRSHLTSDGTTVYTGSVTGRVYAVDAATGAQRWVARVADSTMAVNDPVLVDSVVYVGLQGKQLPNGGGVAAINAREGRVLWSTLLPTEPPRVSGVLFGVGVTPTLVIAATANEFVYGLDRQTGAVRVTIPGETFRPQGVPRANSGVVFHVASLSSMIFIGSSWNIVVALDGTDLHERWRTSLPGVADMRTEADRVYVAGGGLYVLRAVDGKVAWTVPPSAFLKGLGVGESFVNSPALDGDRVYIGGDNGIYAFRKQ